MTDIKNSFRRNGMTNKLIYINIGVFVVIRLLDLLMFWNIDNVLLGNFAMPTALQNIMYKPWTLFTYMFTHYDFIHIIFNLLCLYWFGQIFEVIVGEQHILKTYIIGGLAGAVACLVGNIILPMGSIMIGASAAILALLFVVTVWHPNYRVHVVFVGDIRLKYYAAFFVFVDIVSIPGLVNVGGHVAHLGGALAGVILALCWKKYGLPRHSLFHNFSSQHKKTNLKVIRNERMTDDMLFNANKVARSREIDRILDKIKLSGYESLTQEERQMLFDESKR